MNEKKMLKELLEKCRKKNKELVEKAFYFSLKMHENQKRLSGEPYFIHPYQTALTLAKWKLNNESVSAGLLHDVLEDTKITEKELKKLFGEKVFLKVKAVTEIKSGKFFSKKTIKRKNLEKILLETINKTDVLLIKLADKLHNLETIQFMPKKRQKEIAKTALIVYAPIAQKLGSHSIKFKIEKICFPILYPKKYLRIKKFFNEKKKKKLNQINQVINVLKTKIKEVKFKEFYKPEYILFNKSLNKNLNEINDFIVLIVIVKNEKECYNALRIIHGLFNPIPGKFKDYIAIPKNSSYSGLHTTVLGVKKQPLKIYIQSKKMYENAKKGVITLMNKTEKIKERTEWIKKIKKKNKELKTDKELSEFLEIDSVDKNTFVFNEHGKIIEVPQKTNALDFFFISNPEKAIYLKQIIINKKNSSFQSILTAGDIVKGIYSKKPTVNERWILLSRKSSTHKKIKNALIDLKKHKKSVFYYLMLKTKNVPGVLSNITGKMSENNINIEEIFQERLDRHLGKKMFITLTVKAIKKEIISNAVNELKKIKEIDSIKMKKI